MKEVRLAIIGCGAVVRNSYVRTLPQPPQARVVSVYDRNAEAARQVARAFRTRPAASADEAIAGCDMVMIATPPASHAELAERALRAGRDVFCEKPFVPTSTDARRLVDAARSAGRRIFVGHFRRTFPAVQYARRLVTSGMLGAVTAIDAREGGRFTWAAASDYFLTDPAGGVLLDTGSHTLDTALFAAGLDGEDLAVSVTSVGGDRALPEQAISAQCVLRTSQRDIPLGLGLSRREALANRVRVTCEHGSVDVPVGLLGRIRVTGARGSEVLTAAGVSDYNEAFATQWNWLLAPERAVVFAAERFLGLTAILDAVGAAARRQAA